MTDLARPRPRRRLVPRTAIALVGALVCTVAFVATTAPHVQRLASHTVSATSLGRLESLSIPGRRSGFAARRALVWLPTRVSRGTALPVIVLLHGVPGGPGDWVRAGLAAQTATAFARRHHGVAPIIVMPDINGSSHADTECVVDAFGHSVETYLTSDVPRYVIARFHVLPPGRDWLVAGLSEGGTCAVMLALRHPALFGSFADFSGMTSPTTGRYVDPAGTTRTLFGGSRAAYDAHDPLWLLRNRRYPRMAAWFSCGAGDRMSIDAQTQLSSLARRAGLRTAVSLQPGDHQWSVWQAAFARVLPQWWRWARL